MTRHIPFYSSLLHEEATTNEILLYGLIEVSSFIDGFCYASSEYMAEQLGIAPGTVKNLLSSLSKRGWVQVEVQGNKRIAITPLLGLSVNPKKATKKAKKKTAKPVENSSESVTQELRYRHASVTLASRRNDALDRGVTGEGIINNNNIIKENNKRKDEDSPAGTAGKRPASRLLPKRSEYDSDIDYEKAFYARNTVHLGATN